MGQDHPDATLDLLVETVTMFSICFCESESLGVCASSYSDLIRQKPGDLVLHIQSYPLTLCTYRLHQGTASQTQDHLCDTEHTYTYTIYIQAVTRGKKTANKQVSVNV